MKRICPMKTVLAALTVASCAVFAEDEAAAEATEKKADEAAVAAPAAEKAVSPFYPLLRCARIESGVIEVCVPGAATWQAAEEGRYYPLGSAVRGLADASRALPNAVFAFGKDAKICFTNAAEFATRAIEVGAPARAVELRSGCVALSLPPSLKPGLFLVAAPNFTCRDLAGDSRFEYAALADGDEAVVRVVTGSLAVEGPHYKIARMGAANQVRIRTAEDRLFTSLRGESGDCKVTLAQGTISVHDFETGKDNASEKTLDFQLSPKCAVKIFRGKSPVGGRTLVSVMTFGAEGEMKNRCAFAEGRANVNSGELVAAPKDVKAAKDKAAEAAAAETVEETTEAEKSEEKSEEKGEEKKEESSGDNASSEASGDSN